MYQEIVRLMVETTWIYFMTAEEGDWFLIFLVPYLWDLVGSLVKLCSPSQNNVSKCINYIGLHWKVWLKHSSIRGPSLNPLKLYKCSWPLKAQVWTACPHLYRFFSINTADPSYPRVSHLQIQLGTDGKQYFHIPNCQFLSVSICSWLNPGILNTDFLLHEEGVSLTPWCQELAVFILLRML